MTHSPPCSPPPCSRLMEDALLRYLLLLFISHRLVMFPLSYSFRKLRVSSHNRRILEQVEMNLWGLSLQNSLQVLAEETAPCALPAFPHCPPGCPGQRGTEETGWKLPQPSPSRRCWQLLMQQTSHLPGVMGSGKVRVPLPSIRALPWLRVQEGGAHLLHVKRGKEGGRGAGARKWEGPRHRWAGASGSSWGRPGMAPGGPGSGGFRRDSPHLLVGAAFEALGWESRPDSGALAQAVLKGCSITGYAGQTSRWAQRGGEAWGRHPSWRPRRSVSGTVQAGVLHSCRVPGWTERWGWSEPWSAPLGWGRAELPAAGAPGEQGPA